MSVYGYGDIDPETGLLKNALEYYDYIRKLLFKTGNDNKIKISINVKNNEYTHIFNIDEIFTLKNDPDNPENYTVINTIYTGENLGHNQEFY